MSDERSVLEDLGESQERARDIAARLKRGIPSRYGVLTIEVHSPERIVLMQNQTGITESNAQVTYVILDRNAVRDLAQWISELRGV